MALDYLMPAWNFAKGIYGNQNPTITSSMQQDLINRAQATGLDTGSLGYSDFGAKSLGSGRFGGGIKSLAQEGSSPFANALSLGRVSFNRDPNAPGGYTFGDIKYDFNVDDTPTGTGLRGYLNPENILRGINYGGLKTAIPNFYGDFKAGAGNIWDAIKNEFSGSAQAAEIPNQIMRPGGFPRNTMAANWSELDDIEAQPSGKYEEDDQQSGLWEILRRAGRFINPFKGEINRFGFLPRGGLNFKDSKFYRPATQGVYGYSPAQLNRMNALGGHYSEPARAARRWSKRQSNILNRAAAGKDVGNVNKLLGQHGYQSDGRGGISFTGTPQGDPTAGAGYSRSDDSWSSSTFNRGGLASLWQR